MKIFLNKFSNKFKDKIKILIYYKDLNYSGNYLKMCIFNSQMGKLKIN